MVRYSRVQKIGLLFILVFAGTCLTLFPLWWLSVSSFTPENVIFRPIGPLAHGIHMDNYISGWKLGVPLSRLPSTSVNYVPDCGLRMIGTVASCSAMTAYAFARLEFTGKSGFFRDHVAHDAAVPRELIPRYIMFSKMGWINSFKPLIVPAFLATEGFFIFLMVQFIRGLPVSSTRRHRGWLQPSRHLLAHHSAADDIRRWSRRRSSPSSGHGTTSSAH